jgi:HK97 family phage major capsid protein
VPYNNLISRSDAEALIPEEVSRAMLGKATQGSATLDLFRRVPVSRKQVRFPVLSALPVAYWVTGDTGLKQTTELAWANKYLTVEELATIVPVPDNVIADMEIDVWDTSQPYIVEAFHKALDEAVWFGTNAPSSFPTNVLAGVVAAGNTVTEGTATAAQGGYMGDIDNVIAAVEEDGFDVTGWAASRALRRKLRAARNVQGDKVDAGRVTGDLAQVDGNPIVYPMRGSWSTTGGAGTNVRAIAGDWSQFVVAVRDDISLKISNEAVIQDNTGAIVYNSFQQDLTFLRVTFRIGWQVANTINNDNTNAATRYPAAALMF